MTHTSKIACPHPVNFRLTRVLDRGWGEMACEYSWKSSHGGLGENGAGLPDLEQCSIHEITTYQDVISKSPNGWFTPPDPPFDGWRFRNPTDGRCLIVGLESFSASQGRAWDRHKLAGPLKLPRCPGIWTIEAWQEYRFHCRRCGCEEVIDGPDSGPHIILRTFRDVPDSLDCGCRPAFRYQIAKHGVCAWMDLDESGYIGDSARIGFGPAWLPCAVA